MREIASSDFIILSSLSDDFKIFVTSSRISFEDVFDDWLNNRRLADVEVRSLFVLLPFRVFKCGVDGPDSPTGDVAMTPFFNWVQTSVIILQ